jgi:hypothetical protein
MQSTFPIHPVMRTWTVEVNLCVQPKLLYAAGECPVLRSDRGFDGILVRAGTIEWSWTAVAGGDEQPDAFELWCKVVRVVLLPGVHVCIRIAPKCQGIFAFATGSNEIALRLIVG